MESNSTIVLSIVVTFVSILSPIVIAFINNRHLAKMKQLDLAQENFKNITLHKRELFENYLRLIGEFSCEATSAEISDLVISYYLILPYIPADKAAYFRVFANQIATQDFDDEESVDSNLLHEQIIPTIKKEIEKLQAM
ncbi:hypothetical protein [Enterococcus gallinarum]|uniref:hypothetical protein n=1 Tax=Enterococcus gallinarum TaxID=1353 RepID=UPI002891372D|nr:hypothetical protein [Enterococcus gallinarum]MDT2679867.1 hypothetical protein [Enterococcus gallinarum]